MTLSAFDVSTSTEKHGLVLELTKPSKLGVKLRLDAPKVGSKIIAKFSKEQCLAFLVPGAMFFSVEIRVRKRLQFIWATVNMVHTLKDWALRFLLQSNVAIEYTQDLGRGEAEVGSFAEDSS